MSEQTQAPPAEKVKGKGISTHIKAQLLVLGAEQAISFEDLVKDVREKFPHIKDNTSASARINLVLKQKKVSRDFKKIVSTLATGPKSNKIYIVQKSEVEKQVQVPVPSVSTE